jgi:hypothetical protein
VGVGGDEEGEFRFQSGYAESLDDGGTGQMRLPRGLALVGLLRNWLCDRVDVIEEIAGGAADCERTETAVIGDEAEDGDSATS